MTRACAIRITLAVAFLWALAGGPAATPVRADVSLGVSPSVVELKATPGGIGSFDLTVSNEGSEAFDVSAFGTEYKGAQGAFSAAGWLELEPQSFSLISGQSQKVKVTLRVPTDLPSGGRYAAVGIRTGARAMAGSGTAMAAQVSVPLLITVDGQGTITRSAVLEQLVPVLEPDGRLGFRALVVNRGNVHFAPQGVVEVEDRHGVPISQFKLAERTAILPQSSELLEMDGSLPMEEGGTYRAVARLEYGGDRPATAEADFAASSGLSISSLDARETPDRGPMLRATLRNEGGLGLMPKVQFAVRGSDGKVLGTSAPQSPGLLAPGQTAVVEIGFPSRLGVGEYVLVGRADYGAAAPAIKEAPFHIGARLPTPNPAWAEAPARTQGTSSVLQPLADFNSRLGLDGLEAPLLAASLLVLGAAGLSFLLLRRGQRRKAATELLTAAREMPGRVPAPPRGEDGAPRPSPPPDERA